MPPESLPLDPDPQHQRRLRAARASHWRRARRLTFVLLACWLGTAFGTAYFARELATITVFGWPFSFYMAAQGAALAFLAIIGAYAWGMRRYDRAYERALAGAPEGARAHPAGDGA